MVKCPEYRRFSARSFDADAGADEKLSSRCQSVAPIARYTKRSSASVTGVALVLWEGGPELVRGWSGGERVRALRRQQKKRSPWLKLGKSGDGHPARRVAMRASHW